jgi:hypothetical protein
MRYDRLSVDRELNRAGIMKCDFGEHPAAGASLDKEAAAQLRVTVSRIMLSLCSVMSAP